MVAYKDRICFNGEADTETAKSERIQQLNKLLTFLRRVVSCYIYEDGGAGGGKGTKSKEPMCGGKAGESEVNGLPQKGGGSHGGDEQDGAKKRRNDSQSRRRESSGKRDGVMQDGASCGNAGVVHPVGFGQKAMVRRLINTLRSRFGLDQVLCTLLELEADCAASKGRRPPGNDQREEGRKEEGGDKKKGKQKGEDGDTHASKKMMSKKIMNADTISNEERKSESKDEKSKDGKRADTSVEGPGFAQKLGKFTNQVREHVGADGHLEFDKLFGSSLPVRWASARVNSNSCQKPRTRIDSMCGAMSAARVGSAMPCLGREATV